MINEIHIEYSIPYEVYSLDSIQYICNKGIKNRIELKNGLL